VHTKVCLARLLERLRPAVELPPDLARDDLHHHCSGAVGSAMAAHRDAEHPDGLILEHCRDEPAREQRLAEIPAMDDPGWHRTEFQNLQDIADLKAVRLLAYIRSAGRQDDESLARYPVRGSPQTQRAAR
jgi:hypothetical protein